MYTYFRNNISDIIIIITITIIINNICQIFGLIVLLYIFWQTWLLHGTHFETNNNIKNIIITFIIIITTTENRLNTEQNYVKLMTRLRQVQYERAYYGQIKLQQTLNIYMAAYEPFATPCRTQNQNQNQIVHFHVRCKKLGEM